MTNTIQGLKPKLLKVKLSDFLEHLKLPDEALNFILRAKEVAEKQGRFLYLAGGEVRDFLLKRPSYDVDLVIEGSATDFLEELKRKFVFEVLFSSPFLTYKILLPQTGFEVDLVTARGEVYEDVAVLPKVYQATFKEDVLRRDFTINALIYGLTPPYPEMIVDLVSGISDLERSLLRPLHLRSFVDDPTRVFRGIRYKVRFELNYAEEFYQALSQAIEAQAFLKLSASRLRNELLLFVKREGISSLPSLLSECQSFELFSHSGLKVDGEKLEEGLKTLKEFVEILSPREVEDAFLLILAGFKRENLKRLFFADSVIDRLVKLYEEFRTNLQAVLTLPLIERVLKFDKINKATLIALSLYLPELKEEIKRYLFVYSKVYPELKGGDLKELGIEPGKQLGEILKKLREEKLEGRLKTKDEEIAFVKSLLYSAS
jgi:tRNA nucleotidyltransferase (CCA-adding enzyme)